jgi:hypothetical protein
MRRGVGKTHINIPRKMAESGVEDAGCIRSHAGEGVIL